MKWRLLIYLMLGVASAGYIALLYAADQPVTKAPSVADTMTETVNQSFDLGVKVGFECHVRGGTWEDASILMRAYRSNDIATVKKWFASHAGQ